MKRALGATTRGERAILAALVAGYVVLALVLWSGKDFSDAGLLSFDQRAATDEELADLGTHADRIESDCFAGETQYGVEVKIIAAEIDDRSVFACYDIDETGDIQGVQIVDIDGSRVRDPDLLKPAGVWPSYAVVKTGGELVLGGIGVIVFVGFIFGLVTRPPAQPPPPGMPAWGRGGVLGLLAAVPVLGWGLILVLPGVPRDRKSRFIMWSVVIWGGIFGWSLYSDASEKQDPWGKAVLGYMGAAAVVTLIVGWRARKRLGFSRPRPSATSDRQRTGIGLPLPVGGPSGGTPGPSIADLVEVERPETMHSFAAVGGMASLKEELKETIGLVLAFSEHADAYRVSWNGILLHGDPGVGKTFIAKAVAGEFGLNLLHVSTGDLVSSYRGESARNVEAVFALAARNIPAILFFDEFDSIATRRDDNPDQEARRTVNQLLQSLESTRKVRELIVMAATNDIGTLDPAVIRAGRFDRHIYVPLPDREARRSILAAQLKGRPGAAGVDVDELARRTEGLTPATLAQIVSAASLDAMEEAATLPAGELVPLTTERLVAALKARGGKDRPTVEDWTWDRLILPAKVKAELKEIAALAADPDRAARFGIEPPSGVLLHGPPGTGKTTVARVLAAQANCSFYPVSAADLTSKWLGESERLIAQLFERARENRPSIVFIDEIDAVAGRRGEWGTYDRQVNQLLQEIDGLESARGVLVVGATNRKDILDPALIRGGRLSRHIEIPLPDGEGRRALLALFTKGMPVGGVDLVELADRTDGLSGADLEALCQEAAMQAIIRDDTAAEPAVTAADFAAALASRKGEVAATSTEGPASRTDGSEGYV